MPKSIKPASPKLTRQQEMKLVQSFRKGNKAAGAKVIASWHAKLPKKFR